MGLKINTSKISDQKTDFSNPEQTKTESAFGVSRKTVQYAKKRKTY